jgi:hypothetical protein
MSAELVQPIKASIVRGPAGSYSSTQALVRALPDCIAVFAGMKIRARISRSPPSSGWLAKP